MTDQRTLWNARKSVVWYAVGQVVSLLLDLAIFAVAVAWGVEPTAGNVFSKFSSAIFSYLFHHHVSFEGPKKHHHLRAILSYVFVLCINTALSTGLLMVNLHFLGSYAPPVVLKFFGDIIVAVLTFVLMRTIVFPRNWAQLS